MKRFFAIILTLALSLTIFQLSSVAGAQTDVTVTIDGVAYAAHTGDVIRYTAYLDLSGVDLSGGVPGKFTELEGRLFYDKRQLSLLSDLESDDDDNYPVLPNVKGGTIMISDDNPAFFGYNAIKKSGYAFASKKVLLQLDFEVIGSESSTITNMISAMGSGSVKLIEDDVTFIRPDGETAIAVECPHTAPTEPATEAPTEAPTEPPAQEIVDEDTGIKVEIDPEDVGSGVLFSAKEVAPEESDFVLNDTTNNTIYTIRVERTAPADPDPDDPSVPVDPDNPTTPKPARVVRITIPVSGRNAKLFYRAPDGEITEVPTQTVVVVNEETQEEEVFLVAQASESGTYIVTTAAEPIHSYDIGDVDMDDDLTIVDATYIQRNLAGIESFTDEQILLGDFDRDGDLTIVDATYIQRRLAGLY